MKKSTIVLVSIIAVLISIASGMGVYYYKNIIDIDTIYSGVTIAGHDVGNKTKKETLEYLESKKEPEINDGSMNLVYGQKVYKINLRDLNFSYHYNDAINLAFEYGREGSIINRFKDIRNLKNESVDIPLESHYDREEVSNIVENISREIDRDLVDATFDFNGGNMKITDEIIGKTLLKDNLIEEINNNIYLLNDINIPVEEIQPKVTRKLLSRINGVIGQYSTAYKTSTTDRVENIKLSSRAINGKLLLPGEELSYNKATGPRERKFGYKEANVIIGGELTPGVGGGVCQTSTTMYNALLLSNLTILERHPHSLPPAYVPYGQDAAVAYGYLDLRFKNDFDFPVYIHSRATNENIYISIYGDLKSKDYTVKINPETVEVIKPEAEEIYDGSLPAGSRIDVQKGRTGYKVNTYKSIIRNGKVVDKNRITTDHYRKKDYIYKIGPKAQSVPKVVTEPSSIPDENQEEEVIILED